MSADGLEVLLHAPRNAERWLQALQAAAPRHTFHTQRPADPSAIQAWVGWAPPPQHFVSLTSLRLLLPLGAGVDALCGRPDLPAAAQIARLVDAGMAEQMVEYALYAALEYQRGFRLYRAQQAASNWQPLRRRSRRSVRIGVLGLGALGSSVAGALAAFGYSVTGWSRGSKQLDQVQCVRDEAGLVELLDGSEVLIDLLPSTAETRGLLNLERLARLPKGAHVVLMARGDRYDRDALIHLLNTGHLGAALIDVFASEPLGSDDPLWRCPGVTITPHVAAMTVLEQSIAQIADNLDRFADRRPLSGLVDRQRGY